ncbi:STAS domain-containing protein [Micromonospora endolithica]|uniref:Anti-sigma factor antagonist n=1 Tax=Micromonospora endolithica TaxID=230091 RepID=A0A3A9ZK35_9ACTN|nr:STAS domain-containing protein [Micromonospora endolithica]RKN48569.1 anti-sigma factor antagonist [Micromonospora endolithica]TWJ22106.1 anti-anti-sigma factor [Micromonospora endolithica]
MSFTVTYAEHDDGGAHLLLTGELDMSTVPELTAALDRSFATGARRILLDLTDLTFCDSTGIAAFVRGDNRAAAEGGWLRLTGATGRVDRVLRVTGLADVLGHDSDSPAPTPRTAG